MEDDNLGSSGSGSSSSGRNGSSGSGKNGSIALLAWPAARASDFLTFAFSDYFQHRPFLLPLKQTGAVNPTRAW